MAWWAYTFPLAATATATLSFAMEVEHWSADCIFWIIFVLANLMWLAVFGTTGWYLVNWRLFLT